MLGMLIGFDWIFRWVNPLVYRRLVVIGSGTDLSGDQRVAAQTIGRKQDPDPGPRGPHRSGRANLRDRHLHPLPESPPGSRTPHANRRARRRNQRRMDPDRELNRFRTSYADPEGYDVRAYAGNRRGSSHAARRHSAVPSSPLSLMSAVTDLRFREPESPTAARG